MNPYQTHKDTEKEHKIEAKIDEKVEEAVRAYRMHKYLVDNAPYCNIDLDNIKYYNASSTTVIPAPPNRTSSSLNDLTIGSDRK